MHEVTMLMTVGNVRVCTHIHIHTYIHTYMHSYIHTFQHIYVHTYIQVRTHFKAIILMTMEIHDNINWSLGPGMNPDLLIMSQEF